MMADTVTRSDHYVPRLLLRNFRSAHGHLYAYMRGSNRVARLPIRHAAAERGFHTFRQINGRLDTKAVEQAFGDLERRASRVYRRILDGSIPGVGESDRLLFAEFVGSLLTRGPRYRSIAAASIRETLDAERMRLKWLSGLMEDEIERVIGDEQQTRIETLLLGAGSVAAKSLAAMQWTVLRAPNTAPFITSDSPVALLRKPGKPLLDGLCPEVPNPRTSAELTVALSASIGLLMTWRTPEGQLVPPSSLVAKRLNLRTIASAKTVVLAPMIDRSLLAFVHEHIDSAPDLREQVPSVWS